MGRLESCRYNLLGELFGGLSQQVTEPEDGNGGPDLDWPGFTHQISNPATLQKGDRVVRVERYTGSARVFLS